MTTRKKVIRDVTLHSVKLIIILLVLNWSLQPGGLAVQFLGIDLSCLLPSIIILLTIFYISSLIQMVFILRIAEIAGNALNGLALALALYLFNLTPLAPKLLYLMNFWLFMCMLTLVFNYTTKSLADLYHEPFIGVLSSSISLFLAGISLSNISTILVPYIFSSSEVSNFIPKIISWVFTIASILFPVALFKHFPNPYLHYLGEKISSNITSIIFLLILVLTYFSILRPYILSHYYFIPIPIDLFEWGIICLSFWLFYEKLRGQVRKRLTEQLNLGEWTRLEQEVKHKIDLEQLNIASIIEEFVEYGIKDGIITYIASTMLLNGIEEKYIRWIIKKILDFQEIRYPKICLRAWAKGIDEENKWRRIKLVEEVLSDMRYYWRSEIDLKK